MESGKESEFNEAFLKMRRLHESQSWATRAQQMKDNISWLNACCAIFKEIIGKMGEKEENIIKTKIEKISIKISQNNRVKSSYSGPIFMKPNSNGDYKNVESQLFDLELNLRKLIDKHGFGSPDKKDINKAVLEM